MKRIRSCRVGLGLAALWLAGCQSSSQMSRIDSNRDAYEQWPIEIRQAVLDGKAEPGMTPEMVEVALGKPTEIVTRSGTPATGDDEIWIYRTGGYEDPGMMYPGGGMGGYPSNYPGGYPGGYPGSYPGAGYPGGSTGGGIVIAPGRGGGVGVIPPSIGIGTRGTGISGGIGGIGIGGGGMGGGMPMPVSRTTVEEREVVFRNGVVYRADPPPEK